MLSSGLTPGFQAFRLPRQGHGLEECQDASAGDAERGRFAIADGAAESPYSALWAKLLVEEFVRQTDRLPRWASWLPSLQERWRSASGLAPNGPWSFDDPVPWYLEPGLNQGAFATFLGLVIEDDGWYALAIGDSCLFQVRHGVLQRAFPLTRSADFSNAPWLVGSRRSLVGVPSKNGEQQVGDWQPGDRFWLMTDALAQWFLLQVEEGDKPWHTLETLLAANGNAQLAFTTWIETLRAARELRNDDVTLLVVSV
jgi:hypothetical protein